MKIYEKQKKMQKQTITTTKFTLRKQEERKNAPKERREMSAYGYCKMQDWQAGIAGGGPVQFGEGLV